MKATLQVENIHFLVFTQSEYLRTIRMSQVKSNRFRWRDTCHGVRSVMLIDALNDWYGTHFSFQFHQLWFSHPPWQTFWIWWAFFNVNELVERWLYALKYFVAYFSERFLEQILHLRPFYIIGVWGCKRLSLRVENKFSSLPCRAAGILTGVQIQIPFFQDIYILFVRFFERLT